MDTPGQWSNQRSQGKVYTTPGPDFQTGSQTRLNCQAMARGRPNLANHIIPDDIAEGYDEIQDQSQLGDAPSEVFTAEFLLDMQKTARGNMFVKVKWENYPLSESTWEPLRNILLEGQKPADNLLLQEYLELYDGHDCPSLFFPQNLPDNGDVADPESALKRSAGLAFHLAHQLKLERRASSAAFSLSIKSELRAALEQGMAISGKRGRPVGPHSDLHDRHLCHFTVTNLSYNDFLRNVWYKLDDENLHWSVSALRNRQVLENKGVLQTRPSVLGKTLVAFMHDLETVKHIFGLSNDDLVGRAPDGKHPYAPIPTGRIKDEERGGLPSRQGPRPAGRVPPASGDQVLVLAPGVGPMRNDRTGINRSARGLCTLPAMQIDPEHAVRLVYSITSHKLNVEFTRVPMFNTAELGLALSAMNDDRPISRAV